MENQLNLVNNDSNQSQISFLESRLNHHAKEIAELKNENEDLKKQVKSLLPHQGRKVIHNKEREKMIIENNRVNLDYQAVIIYEDRYGKEDWEIVTDPVKEKIYFLNHRVKILEEKELKSQNYWKFGQVSQKTKALMCWSITALFFSGFYVMMMRGRNDDQSKRERSLQESFICLFLALKSVIWLSYSWDQKL